MLTTVSFLQAHHPAKQPISAAGCESMRCWGSTRDQRYTRCWSKSTQPAVHATHCTTSTHSTCQHSLDDPRDLLPCTTAIPSLSAGAFLHACPDPVAAILVLRLQQPHLQFEVPPAAAAEGANNTSSRRSSATHGISSDGDDEVAQLEQQHQYQLLQQHQHQQQRPAHRQQKQPQQRHSNPKQMKQKQKQQDQKDVGKEWAALTTWLRMNLHNVSTAEAGVGGATLRAAAVGLLRVNPASALHPVEGNA